MGIVLSRSHDGYKMFLPDFAKESFVSKSLSLQNLKFSH